MKKIFTVFCSIILLLSFLGFISIPIVYAEEVTNSPSNYEDEGFSWNEYAYSSDNQEAQMGIVSGGYYGTTYFDYDFPDFLGYDIDEVWVYAEHHSGHVNDTVRVRISWDGGSTWTDWYDMPVTQFEVTWDVDFSSVRSWVPSDFTNDNFRVRIEADIEASGCYFWKSEVSLYEEAKSIDFQMPVKLIADVKKGDVLLGYNLTTGQYIPNVMLSDAIIDKSKPFTFYYIVMEYPAELWDKEIYSWANPKELLRKDVCVTEEQSLYTVELGKVRADEVKVGMHLHGLFRRDGIMVNTPIEIVSIETFEDYGAVTLDGSSEIIFTHYMLAKTTKTYYLDWLGVQVTYSEVGEEEIWDCSYIGTNSTHAGSITELSADWTDLNASKDLDKFLFSWNNSGTIENGTWSDMWDGNWSRVTRLLNSIVGLIVAFRFFVNDSVGVEYSSTICFFKTGVITEDRWITGIMYGVTGGFIFGIMMIAVLASRVRDENE